MDGGTPYTFPVAPDGLPRHKVNRPSGSPPLSMPSGPRMALPRQVMPVLQSGMLPFRPTVPPLGPGRVSQRPMGVLAGYRINDPPNPNMYESSLTNGPHTERSLCTPVSNISSENVRLNSQSGSIARTVPEFSVSAPVKPPLRPSPVISSSTSDNHSSLLNGHERPVPPTSLPESLSNQSSRHPSPIRTPRLDRMEMQASPVRGMSQGLPGVNGDVKMITAMSDGTPQVISASGNGLMNVSNTSVSQSKFSAAFPGSNVEMLQNVNKNLHFNAHLPMPSVNGLHLTNLNSLPNRTLESSISNPDSLNKLNKPYLGHSNGVNATEINSEVFQNIPKSNSLNPLLQINSPSNMSQSLVSNSSEHNKLCTGQQFVNKPPVSGSLVTNPVVSSQICSPVQYLPHQVGPPLSQGYPPQVHVGPPTSSSVGFQTGEFIPPANRVAMTSRYPQPTITSQPSMPQYPVQPQYQPQPHQPLQQQAFQAPVRPNINQLSNQLGGLSVTKDGWNKGWGTHQCDLLQHRSILPSDGFKPPKPTLAQEYLPNCSSDIFRSTLMKVPETKSVLQKSKLPFGVLIHPFKDLEHLPVVSCNTIVRCRACRTYINPFVIFKGERRWECNLCFRVNELPEEFQYDPVSRTYGDPSRRPEVREATIEFIAPQEYMLRPPQPSAYLWVLEVSRQAVETGYLKITCEAIFNLLDKIPGDRRTMIGFITYDTSIQFYLMGEGQKNVQMLEVGEVDEMFIPSPEDLLINLEEGRSLVEELLTTLPLSHAGAVRTQSALGAALQASYKIMSPIGGRITVMTVTLPTVGPGSLKAREDPNQRAGNDIQNIGPATDFYKKLALDCSGQQIAVDLFALNSQYIDMATLTGISKFSGGCIHHFPGFHVQRNPSSIIPFSSCLNRYITRKIGYESVMRIRATRGLSITNFHGNFFVRSTDLLSLPNINPDVGFGMQVNIEEPLHNIRTACFQAALLYTSSRGERRIRVHTLCLPVSPNIHEIVTSADSQAVVGLLAKMAVDRCISSSISDSRDAMVNACVDALIAFKSGITSPAHGALEAPPALQLLPLYTLALVKSIAFRSGLSTKLDNRVFAMCELKTLPLKHLITTIYPDLFPIHKLTEVGALNIEDQVIPQPGRLHLSAERLDRNGAYLMDAGSIIYIYIRSGVNSQWVEATLGVPSFAAIPQPLYEDAFPNLDTTDSQLLKSFISHIQRNKPYSAPVLVLREDNPARMLFIQHLVDDRTEGSQSYVEFLQFIKEQVK